MSRHQTPNKVATGHLAPVEVCLRLIGPLPVLEGIVGYGPKAGYTWLSNTKNRDAGDFPTARLMRRLLDHSDAHALGLTAEMLIRGADAAEIEAILAARASDRTGGHMEAAE